MSKHTPGPWSYWSGYNPYDKIEAQVTAEGGDIVIASYNHLIEQGEANAQLMAAAPDLYTAAWTALGVLTGIRDGAMSRNNREAMVDEAIEELEKAIAKARSDI